jgi:hypothetical protein
MATIDLGKIKIVWRGTYAGGTAYTPDDAVVHSGTSYICIANTTGNAPPNGTYWNVLAQAGTNGTDLTSTLTTQGDIVYRDGSGLARLGAGTSGQFLKTQGTGANPVWGTVVSKLLQAQHYEYTTRDSVSETSSDTALRTWTSSFVKQTATSKLYLWNINPTHGSNAGSQQVMQKFTHSDGTATQVFGSRIYQYSANNNSTLIGMQGVATGLKAGTYSIILTATSRGNANNGGFVINPTSSDDSRYEYSTDAQGTSGIDGSKSTLIVQEIEV